MATKMKGINDNLMKTYGVGGLSTRASAHPYAIHFGSNISM